MPLMQYGPPASPVTMKVGETLRFNLKGRGAAGFVWSYEARQETDVVEVTLGASERPALPPAGGPPPSSYSLDTVVAVLAHKPGKAAVRFSLARLEQKPIEDHSIEILVDTIPAGEPQP